MPATSPSRAVLRRRRIGAAVLLAVVGGGVWAAAAQLEPPEVLRTERCTATVGSDSYDLTPVQAQNAALIAGVAVVRGLPARAASIAIATAVQESRLENIDYGDDAGPDSRGLFQQRPSQGWGTEAQVMDPLYAAGAFYDALVRIPGYETLPITDAAQRVQRSAYPTAYADHEPEGRAFASALTGQSPAALTCVLRKASAPGDPAAVAAAAERIFGPLGGVADGNALVVPATEPGGWTTASWAVATADALSITEVSFAGQVWTRASGEWSPSPTEAGNLTITVAGDPAS
ncbi:hypothetical protein I6N91_08810 [Arthrobacter sp. MSA 4-2]|uniref:hypothetical protein n=1 Tax=Arthrobacter sp. MSA 4-2 TaxID=2794349 RepID=UPI0018E78282|nr:hypothetical protein [Arthrobacter sp. MSA 4-2]MBJ2121076.1 hypothetical protein [Arthrobacter sp. MSA 4-2]